MRHNITEIFLENYHYALTTSVNNASWNDKVNHFPELIQEHLGTKRNCAVIGDKLDSKQLVEFKFKNNLSHIPQKLLDLKNNKIEIATELVNNLFQKTSYFSHMIKNLLDEFADTKRKFAHYKISPFPEQPNDTYFPIKKFKIDSNFGPFLAELIKSGMIIKQSEDDEMKDYFINRCMNKNIKTGYTDDVSDFDKLKRKLVFLKFAPLNNVKLLSISPKKYKVRYLGNQTVKHENNEYSISDEPINIIYLEKIS